MKNILVLLAAVALTVLACRPAQTAAHPPHYAVQYPNGPPTGMAICEVELAGRVSETVTGNRAIVTYVSEGDCLAPEARILARSPALGDGEFFAEVFVPCGTKLGICASVEPRVNPDQVPLASRHYAALNRLLTAQGSGEIEFFGLAWAMRDADEKTFAAPRPYFERPGDQPQRADPRPLPAH